MDALQINDAITSGFFDGIADATSHMSDWRARQREQTHLSKWIRYAEELEMRINRLERDYDELKQSATRVSADLTRTRLDLYEATRPLGAKPTPSRPYR